MGFKPPPSDHDALSEAASPNVRAGGIDLKGLTPTSNDCTDTASKVQGGEETSAKVRVGVEWYQPSLGELFLALLCSEAALRIQ